MSIVDFFAVQKKTEEKHKLAFSWLSQGFVFDEYIVKEFRESVIKKVFGVTIASKEIGCADRIVYDTGIYKVVAVSARARDCIFYMLKWKYCPD